MKKGVNQLLIRGVHTDTRYKLKAAAALANPPQTMGEAVTQAVDDYLAKVQGAK